MPAVACIDLLISGANSLIWRGFLHQILYLDPPTPLHLFWGFSFLSQYGHVLNAHFRNKCQFDVRYHHPVHHQLPSYPSEHPAPPLSPLLPHHPDQLCTLTSQFWLNYSICHLLDLASAPYRTEDATQLSLQLGIMMEVIYADAGILLNDNGQKWHGQLCQLTPQGMNMDW